MHHAFESLDGAVDGPAVFRPESGNDLSRAVIDISDCIDRSDRTYLDNSISAGECPEPGFHCSVIAFQLSNSCSGAGSVIASRERAFIGIAYCLRAHIDIREGFRIAYRQIIE